MIETPIHPIAFKCKDFVFYVEEYEGIHLLHLKINRFSPSIFKKMKKNAHKIAKRYGIIFGYGEEKSTYKLMEMAGFKDSGVYIYHSNNQIRRTLCLQQ